MFCKKCGTNIEENVKFCPNCGEKIFQKNLIYDSNDNIPAKAVKISVDSKKQFIKPTIFGVIASLFSIIFGILFAGLGSKDARMFGTLFTGIGSIMLVMLIVLFFIRLSIEKLPIQHKWCKVIEKVGQRTVIVEFKDGSRATLNVVKEIVLSVGDTGIIGYKYKLISEYEKR